MAIASPSFSASSNPIRFTRPISNRIPGHYSHRRRAILQYPKVPHLSIASRLNASSDGEVIYDLHYSHRLRTGAFPVYVTLPPDAVGPTAQTMRRKKAMSQSFRAIAAAGVEGIVVDVWWGLVEREFPGVYDWRGYMEIVMMAKRFGLKVRAVMAFHQCGAEKEDQIWIPLPQWVLEEMDKDPDIAYADRFGRRNMEYISIGCDILPILHGRSPIQAYADLMRNFRETFRLFLGGVITGIQVGLGPGGELRYPSCPTQKLTWAWRSRELGEFQCYDKYMLASLNACAREIGMREWENGGPIGTGNLMQDPESSDFFRSDGSWKNPYGEFFLNWYSEMLLQHGERICREAETIFRGREVNMSGKVAGIHFHYGTKSHPSELTSGYYNTYNRDGFIPIARMFGRYGFTMCCACFDMRDSDEVSPASMPESFLRQLLTGARVCDVPFGGENSATNLDDLSFRQVLKMSKFYSDGMKTPSFSFNFVKMDRNLFEYRNWVSFTRFVTQMSDVKASLGFNGGDMTRSSASSASSFYWSCSCMLGGKKSFIFNESLMKVT